MATPPNGTEPVPEAEIKDFISKEEETEVQSISEDQEGED